MSKEIRLKADTSSNQTLAQQQQQNVTDRVQTNSVDNPDYIPVPNYFPTAIYGIGQMLGGGIQEQINPTVSIIENTQKSNPLEQFPELQPKVKSQLSDQHLTSILELTSQLNSMNMTSSNHYNNINGKSNNVITSSSIPINQKLIKNMGKKKINNVPLNVGNGSVSQDPYSIQITPPLSQLVAKIPNVIQGQSFQNQPFVQNNNIQSVIPVQPQINLQSSKVSASQLPLNNKQKLRQSNFSNLNQSAPQFLPDDFSQLPSLNLIQNEISAPLTAQNTTFIKTPTISSLPQPFQQVGKTSNVSLPKQASQLWDYKPHNSNYDYNKQLKVSNISSMSEFNTINNMPIPIIPNNNNTNNNTNNTLVSTSPVNYPQIASKIPSNINNGLQSNIPQANVNAFQNTQSYYVPQSQQKISQQSQLNIQQQSQLNIQQQKFQIPNQQTGQQMPGSHIPQQQPNNILNSFAGYAPIGSAIPSFVNEGAMFDKSKLTMGQINSNIPSYMNNAYGSQYK